MTGLSRKVIDRLGAGLALLVLAGCAAPQGFLVPVAATVPDASIVPILAATTRDLAPPGSGLMFSGERSGVLSYAALDISIPPPAARKIGQIQWPTRPRGNPASDFVTLEANILSASAFRRQLDATIRGKRQSHVLLFVHGYNTLFEDAVYRLAQISHDSGAPAVPVLFTWPSRGQLLQYPYDRASTISSRDALEQVLGELAANPAVSEVTVLAHSMGCWLTLEALRQRAIGAGRIGDKVRTVILASPDVDVDVFRTQLERLGAKRPQLVLFVSQNDQALAASKAFWGDMPRIGAVDPSAEPYRSLFRQAGVLAINLTDLPAVGELGHDKFDLPVVARFIGQRLASGQAIGDERAGFAERFDDLAGKALSTVGSAATLVVSAPAALGAGIARQP
jgi:esterase/lipase superfamily enzyme